MEGMTMERSIWAIMATLFALAVLATCQPVAADQHEHAPHIHGQTVPDWYSILCCSGRDCAPITTRAVDIGPAGIKVTLTPEDHPMVTKTITTLFEWDDPRLRESEDWDFHTCVRDMAAYTRPLDEIPDDQLFICLYVPPMSM